MRCTEVSDTGKKLSVACRHSSASSRRSLAVAVVVGLLASLVMVPSAAAAPMIKVTPGAVDAIVNGNCSIREAIEAANSDSVVDGCTAGSGADTINAPGTFVLVEPDNDANGLPVISSTISIKSASITRAVGAPAFRIFAVGSSGNLTLNRVAISGGLASDCPFPIFGGPVPVCGGGIANDGSLTLNNSSIVNNAATNTASGFSEAGGGGVASTGAMNVRNSSLKGNTTSCSGGSNVPFDGCFSLGGAVYNRDTGTLDVKNSDVVNNTASCSGDNCFAVGGALTNDGTSTFRNSRLSDNAASCSANSCTAIGGGIGMFGTVNVTSSQVTGNTASCSTSDCLARGGGLDNDFGGTLNVTSSHVAANTVSAPSGTARGGGLFTGGIGSNTTTVTNSAVRGNKASGVTAEGGGIFYEPAASVILDHTRVSGNTPDNCEPAIGTCT